MAAQGLEADTVPIMFCLILTALATMVLVYIYYKGWKVDVKAVGKEAELPKFTGKQLLSLAALAGLAVGVLFFSWNVGLMGFLMGSLLIIFGCGDEKKAVQMVPWNVIIMVLGVGILMNVISLSGGIDIMVAALEHVMSKRTAAMIMGITSGFMSFFSSGLGVVFPTLIPTVPDIASQVGGASVMQIITAIVCSATVAGISPLSTGGSLILASYAQETDCSDKEQQKMFGTLFALSATAVVIVCVLTFIGVTSFVG